VNLLLDDVPRIGIYLEGIQSPRYCMMDQRWKSIEELITERMRSIE
jgi:hypothetical protein